MWRSSKKALEFAPPKKTVYTLKSGQSSMGVWALQRAINSIGLFGSLMEDGVFGPNTKRAVTGFQDLKQITADGIAGPQTQDNILLHLIGRDDQNFLPKGLLLSIVDGESGRAIAAVNWNVEGGVDCGFVQRRVQGPPFAVEAVKRAFDSEYQLNLLKERLRSLYDIFTDRPAVKNSEMAWRLATLQHNYPLAADRISRDGIEGLSSYWTKPQDWVKAIGAKFPDGFAVVTPLQWCQFYSLGAPEHDAPGRMVRLVESWV